MRGRREIRALVLTPTRELAIQIDECCRDYARYMPIRHCVIFGGVKPAPRRSRRSSRASTCSSPRPGRLLDLIGQGYISLTHLRFFVLDEADRMLDMGFIHDIRRILPLLPERRQTLFFSAHDARGDRRTGGPDPPRPGAGVRDAPGIGRRNHCPAGALRREERGKAPC